MKQNRDGNERIKRQYFNWLKKAKGQSDSTIQAAMAALWEYGELTNHSDFRRFSSRTAEQVAQKLVTSGKSIKSRYRLLKQVRSFLEWLASQPGYRSRIRPTDIDYLSLDRRETSIANTRNLVSYPSIDYVRKLADSIEIKGELDRRDRAIVAWLYLTGMRDGAIVTFPIGCFDPETRRIDQLPSLGVATKFSKPIHSLLFRFDEVLVGYVLEWYNYLVKEKFFASGDPLFPRTKNKINPSTRQFEVDGVEPVFWKGPSPLIAVLQKRSEAAGLRYYHPHTFRHSMIQHALKECKSDEERRALAEIVGHARVFTTMYSYGRIDPDRALTIADQIGKT